MKNGNRSKEELRSASDALHYEISMLRFVVRALGCPILGDGVGPIRNALIESFATHVRVLIEFFYRDKDKKDTILAKHFFLPPKKWIEIRPAKSRILEQAETRANKLLAHLTYTRCKKPLNKEWPIKEIANELEGVSDILFQNMPEELLGSSWKTNPDGN